MKDRLNPNNEQMKTLANQTNIKDWFSEAQLHGTSEQRPPNPLEGFIRRNTTLKRFEIFVDGEWQEFPNPTQSTPQKA